MSTFSIRIKLSCYLTDSLTFTSTTDLKTTISEVRTSLSTRNHETHQPNRFTMTNQKAPTNFLSLPIELRQKILLYILTDDALFKQDFQLNHLLSKFSTTIRTNSTTGSGTKNHHKVLDSNALMIKIVSHVHEDMSISKVSPLNTIHVTGFPSKEINHGFIPSHTISLASNLSSIHPKIKKDMSWVIEEALHQMTAALSTYLPE